MELIHSFIQQLNEKHHLFKGEIVYYLAEVSGLLLPNSLELLELNGTIDLCVITNKV